MRWSTLTLSFASCCPQPLSPLELVKAARKAHGESTNVGSEVDLWGEEAASSSTGDDKEDTVMVSEGGGRGV